jgi:glycosyltransferase involved in cell wall biosynthesis
MRIAAVLGVKDEVELIDSTIAHLRNIGVDAIIACDMGSTDGTLEVLEQYRSDSDLLILQLNEQTTIEEWSRANLQLARKANVDWVVFIDADEYLLPAKGSLRHCEGLVDADVVNVDIFNVPVGPTGPLMPHRLEPSRYGEVALIVKPFPGSREYFLENPAAPIIRMAWPPKVMVRPDRIVRVMDGAHSVVPVAGAVLRSVNPSDLLIAHLPFSTQSRFARKIDNIRRAFEIHEKNLAPDSGWHWRRWLALADEGRLSEEFNRNIFDADMIAMLRADGVVSTALEVFQNRTNAAREAELATLRNDLALRDAEIVSLRGLVDRASARTDALLHSWQHSFRNFASSKLYRKTQYEEDYRIIQSSGLFDAKYYLTANRNADDEKQDPVSHFILKGASELRNPNAEFDTAGYLANNYDVLIARVNPFVHYLIHGRKEGR